MQVRTDGTRPNQPALQRDTCFLSPLSDRFCVSARCRGTRDLQICNADCRELESAYDYNAAASLKLHRLDDAEKSALKAIEIDRNHTDPRVHFLLAQIYEAKGEREKEEGELREYLKSGPSDAAMVQ